MYRRLPVLTGIRAFQFRDIRPKAASEMDLEHASKLLGHTDTMITEKVYRRIGETVKPIKCKRPRTLMPFAFWRKPTVLPNFARFPEGLRK